MRWRKSYIDGTFGDKTVLLTSGVIDAPRGVVLLFHGVHSSANSEPGNKYARIGVALAEEGFLPVLAETSRLARNRYDYANDPMSWIRDAFTGKTYEQELSDLDAACRAVKSYYPTLPLSLWGFSLGGLNAVLIAGNYTNANLDIDGLVICGSGDGLDPENYDMFKLPILDTIPQGDGLITAAKNCRAKWARLFRGTQDETFSSESSRRLYDAINVPDKAFYEIENSDHTFRFMNGLPSRKPLKAVYALLPQFFAQG